MRPRGSVARLIRLLLGLVAYPVCVAAVWYVVVHHHDSTWLPLAALAVPGVVFGALVGRWWLLVVPPLGNAILFAVLFARDPTCSTCGDHSWLNVGFTFAALLTAPAVVAVLAGVVGRRLAGWASRGAEGPEEY